MSPVPTGLVGWSALTWVKGLTAIGGRHGLRLARNPATGALYTRIHHAVAA